MPLTSDAASLSLIIGRRDALVSGDGGKPLSESDWLTLNIHGLENEDVAHEFGRLVSPAVLLAGTRRGVGIDAGEDRATASFSSVVDDKIAEQGSRKLRPNVHGLDVYKREGNEVFMQPNGIGRVTIDPAPFLNEIAASFDETAGLGEREQIALGLIALSKIAREPLAEAALCISAVELLSDGPDNAPWTTAQKSLLKKLRAQASDATELPDDEAKQVACALQSVFQSISKRIERKMKALELTDADCLFFKKVYDLRSRIFHGPETGRDQHTELANKARDICARIVLAAAQKAHEKGSLCLSRSPM
jgi:hypothetical protein